MASGAQPGSLVPPRSNSTRGVLPGLHIPDNPKVDSCAHVDTYYDLTAAAVGSVYITFGILYTFFGKSIIIFQRQREYSADVWKKNSFFFPIANQTKFVFFFVSLPWKFCFFFPILKADDVLFRHADLNR